MILLIISHTPHYYNAENVLVSWGATAREIDYLSILFDKVIHVAPLYSTLAPSSSLPYTATKVEFRPIVPTGGPRWKDKLSVIIQAPATWRIVKKALRECDVFQFRAPTGMGVYMIPLLMVSSKKGWFKYAGNWVQNRPPFGYAVQRWLLKHTQRVVTINGHWAGQKAMQLSFENPCLTQREREEGMKALMGKDFSGKIDLVFVGRLEDAKGVRRILKMLADPRIDNKILRIHFIGDGVRRLEYEKYAQRHCPQKVIFYGFLPKEEVNKIYAMSHIFLLPSTASEGFPKVVAEAANYGCIPVVSNVSCLSQYIIHGQNGYVMDSLDKDCMVTLLNHIVKKGNLLNEIAHKAYHLAAAFTYQRYTHRIAEEILR